MNIAFLAMNYSEESHALYSNLNDLEEFRFIVLKLLRRGTFVEEYSLVEARSKAYFMIKIFKNADPRRAEEEVAILKNLMGCPNIIRLIGALVGGNVSIACLNKLT